MVPSPIPVARRANCPVDGTSAVIAAIVTIYFWWQNIKGIEESSDKALKVMKITTVMVVILLGWGFYSVFVTGDLRCLRYRYAVEPEFQQGCSRLPEEHQFYSNSWACSV